VVEVLPEPEDLAEDPVGAVEDTVEKVEDTVDDLLKGHGGRGRH
jgi:hypothetical protein